MFLLFAEIALRIAGYGNDLSLFLTDQTGKYYYLNPQIGKRYFTQEINATNGNMDFFKKKKAPGTLRIFVLGSSTALGFPYMFNGAFPQMLKYRLQRHFPELNIEMINLSISAINSYAVLDIAKEISKYKPDAVLVYAGQNEYHGTLGVASSSKFGNNSFLINLFIKSKHSRLMQLIYHIIYTTNLNLTLMERLAAGQQIPYGSYKYRLGIKHFEQNMSKMLDLFSSKNIPVFIGTLVTNKRGIHPFISDHSNSETSAKWDQLFKDGQLELEEHDTLKAFRSFSEANKLDSTYAECQFQLGEISYARGDFKAAKIYYTNAKELDQLRFRAPEAFNEILRRVASERKGIYVADIASAFETSSPHNIVGDELMLEHVHPNLQGYYLIADTFFKSIMSSKLIQQSWYDSIPEEILKEQMPVTRFDTVYGYISNILLKENWPFNEPLPKTTPAELTYEGKVAGGLAVKQYSWEDAMEKLLNHYLKNNDYANALRIAEGQCLEFPFKVTYFESAAKLAQHENDDSRALFYLTKIWNNFAQSKEIARQLVITTLNADKPGLAMPFLNYLIANAGPNNHLADQKNEINRIIQLEDKLKLMPDDLSIINEIAVSYLHSINYKAAQKYIDLSLRLDPNNLIAKSLKIQSEQIK
jgi:tetratricopeptide (TPR) repeat protein